MLIDFAEAAMEIARDLASRSKDPSTKVGAVLLTPRGHMAGGGYNGFPRGIAEDHRMDDREVKYAMVVHAEIGALLAAGPDAHNAALFVTHPPCSQCMGALIEAGVAAVFFPTPSADYLSRWAASMQVSKDMAIEAGVQWGELK